MTEKMVTGTLSLNTKTNQNVFTFTTYSYAIAHIKTSRCVTKLSFLCQLLSPNEKIFGLSNIFNTNCHLNGNTSEDKHSMLTNENPICRFIVAFYGPLY